MKKTTRKSLKIQFHHIGLPTDVSQPGEVFVSDTKVWVTDPRKHPYKVEFLRFEKKSPVKGPVRDLPHVAYRVNDMDAALKGAKVLLKPFSPSPGFMVAFVIKDGAVVEYMTFKKDRDLPWK
ncbi:MAG: hypothetical protein WCQ89_05595 [Verrucomicrobiota bacterium]